jgi:hypothetical protein
MPVKQIEYAIQEAQTGRRTYASIWLPVLDHWIRAHEAGRGQGFPVTLKDAESLRERLRSALAADPHRGSTAQL